MVVNSSTEVVSIACEMRAVGLMGGIGVFTESVRHVDPSVTNEPQKEDPPKKDPLRRQKRILVSQQLLQSFTGGQVTFLHIKKK